MARILGPWGVIGWLAAHGDTKALAGAAFLIRQDIAVTCAHVIRDHLGLGSPTPSGAPTAKVVIRFEALEAEIAGQVLADGWFPETARSEHGISDVAIIRLERAVEEAAVPAAIARAIPNQRFDAFVFGAEPGYEGIGQEVRVTIGGNRNAKGWRPLESAPTGFAVKRGFSGAPAMDELGNTVWGMIAAVDAGGERVSFAIPADDLRRAFDRAVETHLTDPEPPRALAETNIPEGMVPRVFRGREIDLAEIERGLAGDDKAVAITALHGLRGVGKTVLAAAYAEQHRVDYRAIWWVRAETEAGLRADLVGLGVRLGWVPRDEKEEPALAVVKEQLRNDGAGILLIFDNARDVEALRSWLPRGGASRILVTSNAPNWGAVATPVEIRVWPKETGADFLIARAVRQGERAAAEALSEALGGLPLAHEMAASYCDRTGTSFAAYRGKFDAAPVHLLDIDKDAPTEYHDRLTVAKTFALAIEEAAKQHPAAEKLIVHAALMAPEPIPLFLFTEGRKEFGEELASLLADDGLDEAVAALRAFALIDREAIPDERDPAITTDSVRLHRLVREVAAGRREGSALGTARRGLIEAIAAVYPRDVERGPAAWPRARRLDAPAMALVGGDAPLPQDAETAVSLLIDGLGRYRTGVLAAYAPAHPLFEQALAIREKALGPDHPDTAMSLNNLAALLQDQGDLAAARPLFERALAINEKALGLDHPDTARNLNNLATLLQDQGDLAAARPLYEQALAINEKALGPDHPETATSLNNLAPA